MVTSLFVYGTLLPGQLRWPVLVDSIKGHDYELRPGKINATMYNLGDYPAVIKSEGEVHGVVVMFDSLPVDLLPMLDMVEGVEQGLYERSTTTVSTKNGEVTAYAYFASNKEMLMDVPVIAEGRWV